MTVESPAGGGRAVHPSRAERLLVDDVLPELYRQLRRRMGLVLYRYRIPPEDGEDLIQTVLLLAVGSWGEIRDPAPWLLCTLANRCSLYWRQRQQARRYRALDDIAPEPVIEPAQPRRDLLIDVGIAARHLSVAQRRLLALRYGLGLSPPEAAVAMGLARSSVRKTTNRALTRLRELLGTVQPRRARLRPRAGAEGLAVAGAGADIAEVAEAALPAPAELPSPVVGVPPPGRDEDFVRAFLARFAEGLAAAPQRRSRGGRG